MFEKFETNFEEIYELIYWELISTTVKIQGHVPHASPGIFK